jgi:type I restriction enzyme S subunit
MSEPKCRLGDIAQINPETLGIDTASDYFFKYIDISSVNQGVIDWSSVRSYQFCDAPSRARRIIRQNDVLICTVRPGLQAHCFIGRSDYGNLVASTGFAVVRCGSDISPRYLFHSLFGPDIPAQLRKKETGSNYPAVNERDIQDIFILCPAITIQNKIARILDTLDEAILKTEQLIAKLKAIKQGLLHDLLTRGLDENGRLRDPVAHPEQFKPSPLGPIPKEWEVYRIDEIGKVVSGTTPSRAVPKYWGGEIPWITPTDMSNLTNDYISGGHDSITKIGLESCSANLLPIGSIVVTTRATLGLTAVTIRELATNQGFKNNIPNNGWNSLFLCYKLRELSNEMIKGASGTTFLEISGTQFALLKIEAPIPESKEQDMIANVISVHNQRIEKEELYLEKLRLLKKGLMHDLLTGKVRVNIKEENRDKAKGGNPL